METKNSNNSRLLCDIAVDILNTWKNPSQYALCYIMAMQRLTTMDSSYGLDPAVDIVNYFLSNASTWRGPDARRIKVELNQMIKKYYITGRNNPHEKS